MILRSFLVAISLMLLASGQFVAASVGNEEIERTVSQFMTDYITRLSSNYGDDVKIDYEISAIDPRLSMADCGSPLSTTVKSQHSVGKINVQVSCTAKRRWSLYIPVNVNLYRPVVAVVTPVARGVRLAEQHLELREVDVSRLNGSYFVEVDQVLGMEAKRPLPADKILKSSHLQRPLLIRRGETVVMTAESGPLSVKITGEALADGHLGQQISVRNSQSKRVVDAKVSAYGQVTIVM